MRRLARTPLTVALVAPLAVLLAIPAGASPHLTSSAVPATERIVVRPVTPGGHPAPGFSSAMEMPGAVDCRAKSPSPVSLSPNVDQCSPASEYAVACWRADTTGYAMCLRDPRKHTLSEIALQGRFARTPAVSRRIRAPFVIVLADGASCSLRVGGAVGPLERHPNYVLTYICLHGDGGVWTKPNSAHYGVDESGRSWTVQTARGATRRLVTRHVVQAYFVATAPKS